MMRFSSGTTCGFNLGKYGGINVEVFFFQLATRKIKCNIYNFPHPLKYKGNKIRFEGRDVTLNIFKLYIFLRRYEEETSLQILFKKKKVSMLGLNMEPQG